MEHKGGAYSRSFKVLPHGAAGLTTSGSARAALRFLLFSARSCSWARRKGAALSHLLMWLVLSVGWCFFSAAEGK